ncbi:MAG: ribonuclease E/G, partial [Aldersonia sp.]|nr:ribonuclease E/G [Aldersonia sp.]
PELTGRLSRFNCEGDVFRDLRIDEQLAKALERKVWLPSGGTLVIDRTEAMTVVDVNTGKFTGAGGNLEETVTRNNLEAAEEIVRQMRLRDIGGMIVVDFIDMVLESNRDLVLRRLTEALGRDRTRHQVSEVTSLGLVQMTRKKLGMGLVEAFSTTCEHCHGRGLVLHSYPVEVGGGDDRSSRGETPSRKRRGRDRSSDSGGNGQPASEKVSEVDPSVKRAHPVALAMAAHHAHDHDTEQAPAGATAEAAEAADTAGSEGTAEDDVTVVAGVESVDTSTGSAPTGVEVPGAQDTTPAEPPAAEKSGAASVALEAEAAVPVATDVAAEPTPKQVVPAPQPEQTAASRRPARRRVSRAASAPASDSAGTVIVLSATEAEQAEAEASKVAAALRSAPTAGPRTPRRRRAAGRPAGPPPGDGEA